MSSSVYKAPSILQQAPSYERPTHNYVGVFAELKTVDTIEEALRSFDELEERRRIRKSKAFAYKD